MLALISLALLFSTSVYAVETEISGNLEAQSRHSWNNEEAKEDLFQDWDQEQFHLVYGNLNGVFKFKDSHIGVNWFVRQSYSKLYDPSPTPLGEREPYIATQIYTFPNRLVARDIFKLQYDNQENNYRTESVLNKLYYQWDFDEHRFTIGRMYINYGLGEIFNPMNPFNQPTGLTAISQVAQGNDGIAFTYFVSDKYTINFYFLGDKRIEGYDGQIDKTLWAHGEYQATDKLQLDYVIGEDQNRHKLGGQAAYRLADALIFSQVLFQTEYVNKKPSDNLWDVLLGFDQQLTAKWHLRTEAGYQKRNTLADINSFGDRFLPTEYFIALANQYEFHPLFKAQGTLVHDIKSGFTYLIAKGTYSLTQNIEAELFGFSPLAQGGEADQPAQKLVTTDVGVALRAFF